MSENITLRTYSHGNNIGSLHFVWKVLDSTDDMTESQLTDKRRNTCFHTRAMKVTLSSKFGRVTPNMKPAILCALYRELTNEASAPVNLHETEIDERMKMILEMDEADIVLDLRHLNSEKKENHSMM